MASAPEQSEDYATKLAELVESRQVDHTEQNQWQEFVDVAALVSGAWEYFARSNARVAAAGDRDPNQQFEIMDPLLFKEPAYADLLPEVRGFLVTLDKSKLMSRLDGLVGSRRFVALRAVDPLISTPAPDDGNGSLCEKVCLARMRISAIDGKPEQAVRSLGHALAMARGVEARGTLFVTMVSWVMWSRAEREVRWEIVNGWVKGEACASMLRVLSDSRTPSIRAGLAGERFFVLEAIDLVFDKAKEEAGANQAQGAFIDRGIGGVMVPREEQVRQANRLFDAIDELFSADEAARRHGREELDAVRTLCENEKPLPLYEPLRMTIPTVEEPILRERRDRVWVAGTQLMLALEVFRARMAHYPERLQELVPDVLAELPRDPFAPDGAFRYRRMEPDGSDPAKSYLLYSVGLDGEDNGGKEARNPVNALGGGPWGRGYDYIINSREP